MHQYGYANSSDAPTPVIPNAENARPSAAVGTANVRPFSRSAGWIWNLVHCRITTLATVNSVTAATRTVVIFSSRLYPPESSRATAARVVRLAQTYSSRVCKNVYQPGETRPASRAIASEPPGKA